MREDYEQERYSVVSDYLGTPTHAYNSRGENVWERELDVYGSVTRENGEKGLVPQLYQGQWVDEETGLAYNRFRYYDNEGGRYLSQDPIRLIGGKVMYGYVGDPNCFVDSYGLEPEIVQIDPNRINYSQAYVSENVNDYIDDMRNNRWDWERSGPVRVAEIDGQLVSLDNRRLLAAQEAGLLTIPTQKVNLGDALPLPATGGTYESNLKKKLNSKPKGSDVPRVKLPDTGSPNRPKIVEKPKHH